MVTSSCVTSNDVRRTETRRMIMNDYVSCSVKDTSEFIIKLCWISPVRQTKLNDVSDL